jgi:hypothetical protein
METFNLEKAHELEKIYLNDKNFKGLAEINIEFCERLSSDFIYKSRMPKIGFYLGRIQATEKLKNFLERNKDNFFFIPEDILELTLNCFKYGYEYEHLSVELKNEIKYYFTNPSYSELFTEMMFDYKNYFDDIEPFDYSIRNIRNSEFEKSLVDEIGEILLENDGTKYYNKPDNIIVEIDDYEDSIRGVDIPIDYSGITNKMLDSVIQLLLEKLNINDINYKTNILKEILGEQSDSSNMYAFNGSYIDDIITALLKNSKLAGIDSINLKKMIMAIVAKDFLEFVNEIL